MARACSCWISSRRCLAGLHCCCCGLDCWAGATCALRELCEMWLVTSLMLRMRGAGEPAAVLLLLLVTSLVLRASGAGAADQMSVTMLLPSGQSRLLLLAAEFSAVLQLSLLQPSKMTVACRTGMSLCGVGKPATVVSAESGQYLSCCTACGGAATSAWPGDALPCQLAGVNLSCSGAMCTPWGSQSGRSV